MSSVHQHELAELAQRAEAAARESEERYRTLFDLVPVAVYSCDVSGVILDFNRVAAELLRCQPMGGYPRFGVVCFFRDISESVIAREALRESDERFLAMADIISPIGLDGECGQPRHPVQLSVVRIHLLDVSRIGQDRTPQRADPTGIRRTPRRRSRPPKLREDGSRTDARAAAGESSLCKLLHPNKKVTESCLGRLLIFAVLTTLYDLKPV